MNCLLEQGQIQDMACGSNFAYTLTNNDDFLPIEYKVLQSQSSDCFVKCVKMLFNGKVQLFYMVNNYKPLSMLLTALNAESFSTVVTNVFTNVMAVKSNGFLSCNNIDISFDKIYVDPNTLKVGLVYLPIGKHLYYDYFAFENELRSGLVRLINSHPNLASNRNAQLCMNLSNGMISLEDLLNQLRGGKTIEHKVEVPAAKKKSLRIVALNAPTRTELVIDKAEYIIGKKASEVDGVISFNKSISRVHCRINSSVNGYSITDLESANGTYVNRVRLKANQTMPIKDGDIIRLANSDFQVVIR